MTKQTRPGRPPRPLARGSYSKRLGIRLRRARKKLKLTLADVTAQCGVPDSVVSRYELGEVGAKVGTLRELARCYGVPLKELLPDR